jgi:hypothetical protein
MRRIAWLVTLSLLAAGCGGSDSTNAGPSPAQTPQASGAAGSATSDLDPIVGEWLRANTCEDLVQALAKEGLQEFAAQSVGGAALLTTPENVPAKDPMHPCADAAGPIDHSHKFWADGTFNSYNQFGEEVDEDESKSSTRTRSSSLGSRLTTQSRATPSSSPSRFPSRARPTDAGRGPGTPSTSLFPARHGSA